MRDFPNVRDNLTLFGLADIFLMAVGEGASPSRTTIFRAEQRELLERVVSRFFVD